MRPQVFSLRSHRNSFKWPRTQRSRNNPYCGVVVLASYRTLPPARHRRATAPSRRRRRKGGRNTRNPGGKIGYALFPVHRDTAGVANIQFSDVRHVRQNHRRGRAGRFPASGQQEHVSLEFKTKANPGTGEPKKGRPAKSLGIALSALSNSMSGLH